MTVEPVLALVDTWALTAVKHPALRGMPVCPTCLACAPLAVTIARLSGAVGGSYNDADHKATVARVIRMVEAPL